MVKPKSFSIDQKPFIILRKLVSNFKKRKPISPSPSYSTRRYLSNPTPSSLSQLSLSSSSTHLIPIWLCSSTPSQAHQLIRSLSGCAHQLSLSLLSFSLSCVSRSISRSIFLYAASHDPSQDLSFSLASKVCIHSGLLIFSCFPLNLMYVG